jgi:3-phosphoglycerate kinase
VQLLLLENVRFYKEEEKNDAEFAKKVRFFLFFKPNSTRIQMRP